MVTPPIATGTPRSTLHISAARPGWVSAGLCIVVTACVPVEGVIVAACVTALLVNCAFGILITPTNLILDSILLPYDGSNHCKKRLLKFCFGWISLLGQHPLPPNIQNVLHHKHASFLTLPSLQHVDSWHFHSTNLNIPVELVLSVLQHCDTSEQVSATHSVTKNFHDYLPHEICFYFFAECVKFSYMN